VRPDKHRLRAWFVVLMAAAVLLAGCGDDDEGAGTTTTGAPDTTTTTTSSTTTTENDATAAPVATASNPQLGDILVDAEGLTLYVFDNDKDGTIACLDQCTSAWPPAVLAAGESLPTSGDLSADLSTVDRPDGAKQIAYEGRPLYRFAGDAKAGDTNGDGVAGVWHVVKAAGGAASSSGAGGIPGPY
jgi:predicted lipoprotein with Yx(FWY)xxD motif